MKVLYFAENAISPIQGGGIVVYASLRGLPPENLLGIYRYRNVTPAPEYAARLHPLPMLRRSEEAVTRIMLPPSRLGIFGEERTPLDLASDALGPLLDKIGAGYERFVTDLVEREQFRPEVVYTAPLSLRMLLLAVSAAKRYGVPLVMLNMDDWMAAESERFGWFAGFSRRLIARGMEAARPHVAYAYSNSAKLAEVLSARYGIPHETVNNASDDLLDGRPKWNPPPVRPRTVITFAGAMNWHLQGQALVRVAEAVAELAAERDIELRIFTPWEFAPLANMISVPGSVTYGGFLARPQLADAYLDSDFLVLTTTFRDDKIAYFRHSLATKLSDYLCAGRPVLSFGHPDWAVHDYVEQNACGIAGRRAERLDVKRQLLKAIEMSDEERAKTGQRNRLLWERAHDVRVMSRNVRAVLGLD